MESFTHKCTRYNILIIMPTGLFLYVHLYNNIKPRLLQTALPRNTEYIANA